MNEASGSFELHEPKFIKYLAVVCLLFFAALLCASVFSMVSDRDFEGAVFCGMSFGSLSMLAVFMLLIYHKYRLLITPGECTYSTLLRRPSSFYRSDIRSARLLASGVVRLYASDGRKLAQAEYNMTNFPLLLQFLEAAEIPLEHTLPPKLPFPSEKKQRRREALTEWALPDAPGWQLSHIRLVRFLRYPITVLSFTAAILPLLFHKGTLASLAWCIAPLPLYFLLLLFPEAIVLEKPDYASKAWKKAHISFPFVTFLLPCLLMLITSDVIHIVETDKQILLGLFLFFLLFGLYLLRRPCRCKGGTATALICLLLILYSFGASFHLNNGLPSATAHHTMALIQDSEINDSGAAAHYILFLPGRDGSPVSYDVSKNIYQDAIDGVPLVLCTRTSIFGIRYQTIHKG